MWYATLWVYGTEYRGCGKERNEALADLQRIWKERCVISPTKPKDYIEVHAEEIVYRCD